MQQASQHQQTRHAQVQPGAVGAVDYTSDFQTSVKFAEQWSGMIRDKRLHRKVNVSKFMGLDMAQAWPDLLIWEAFFNQYPIKTFIELGTGHGGLALFFAMQCKQRGINYDTFDNQRCFKDNPLIELMDLEGKFHHVDIFKEGHDIIRGLLENSPRPLAIFFDDGDKPREWRTFTPYTRKGDFCIVHDWGTEFREADLGNTSVVRILGSMSDKRPEAWKAMWFQRV